LRSACSRAAIVGGDDGDGYGKLCLIKEVGRVFKVLNLFRIKLLLLVP
jgi:hypothetical protein